MDEHTTALVEREVSVVVAAAEALTITTQEDYVAAGEFRRRIVEVGREIDRTFGKAVKAAHAAHVAAKELEKKARQPLADADRIVSGKRTAWWTAREAEAAAAREAAAREARARIEAAAAEAAALADAGEEDIAEAVVEQATTQAAAIVAAAEPDRTGRTGFSLRTTWRARVVDAAAVPREWCCPDERRLGEEARRTKGETTIPGVEFYAETTESKPRM